MKAGFWRTVKAAFNARPLGMWVPPNWIGLAAFAILGFVNPGFWLVGAGVELAYLAILVSNARFQRTVYASGLTTLRKEGQAKIDAALAELGEEERRRYRDLERQCQAILRQQQGMDGSLDVALQGDGLGRLLWVYLRLLQTRLSIRKTLDELLQSEMREGALVPVRRARAAGSPDPGCEILEDRIRGLQQKIAAGSTGEEVKRSLAGQVEILQQRLRNRKDALDKLDFLEAELTRIQEQVKLIREQASVATDPGAVSSRIDQIATTLGGTTQWVREQQRIYGMAELLEEPPPLVAAPRKEAKESQ
jgi:hypothetical protein